MITLINKDLLYNSFGVDTFETLEQVVESMAPSLVEYYLSSLCENSDEIYLNKKEIESSILIGDYNLYIDYSKNVYLEIEITQDEQTQSFW